MAAHQFQTEVSQLLHLIIHSLYSHKEIFLRELISNASDALDKLKYLTLTDEAYKSIDFSPRIDISFTEGNACMLTVSDTGIGMNEKELIENLGTIARSGTRAFLEKLSGDAKRDSNLIGQFGVGFYSSFMVAEKVEVITRRAGEEKAYHWSSDGRGEYEIEDTTRDSYGTTVILHLNENGKEFANRWRIDGIIKKYSNHIPFPIYLHYEEAEWDEKGNKKKETAQKTDQVNSASALWKRPKSELKEEDYFEFYRSIAHESDDPLLFIHTHAEGTMDYTTLFYIPRKAPFDMYYADYRPGVKLYVKRVFITDDDKELMPVYLRFLRGVIDSEDLPLNVSREILQQNNILRKIRQASVKKVLSELEKLAETDKEKYIDFWKEFGRPMKEGLYSDHENRETLLKLARFKSTKVEGYTSLLEYEIRMVPEQKAIYYITGQNEKTLRQSPLLEMYNAKGIEVLIMDDDLDDVIIPMAGKYKEFEFKSVNRSDAADDLKTSFDKEKEKEAKPLIEKIKKALGDRVKEVKASTRLSDSPSCIVADSSDPTVQMQAFLKTLGKNDIPEFKPILEINPTHSIIRKLSEIEDEATFGDVCMLLFEQAMLVEGMKLEDPAAFARRLNNMLDRAVEKK